jgi:hypothetical protein
MTKENSALMSIRAHLSLRAPREWVWKEPLGAITDSTSDKQAPICTRIATTLTLSQPTYLAFPRSLVLVSANHCFLIGKDWNLSHNVFRLDTMRDPDEPPPKYVQNRQFYRPLERPVYSHRSR